MIVLNKTEKKKRNIWIDGMMGVVIGDALGMPVQFKSREIVKMNPITKMEGYGTYNMPPGTWSDDSSMAIATLDSIYKKNGIDCDDIMIRFAKWTIKGEYTPAGIAFDQGNTCIEAIYNYMSNKDYKTCGLTGEWANGNGALMRIMPVCLYAYVENKKGKLSINEALEFVHQVSALTHNHLRSKMACGIYFFMIQSILDNDGSFIERLQKGIDNAKSFYISGIVDMANATEKTSITNMSNTVEWLHYERMNELMEFKNVPENKIKSSGYVVDSLEAAVWSLISTNSFDEGLLKAVNLGDDSDTVGAIAGGLAGLFYGYENVPDEWKNEIINREKIIKLCEKMEELYYV